MPINGPHSWLENVAQLLAGDRRKSHRRMVRGLTAEQLERRAVLSSAPAADVETSSTSLAAYVAQTPVMGPIAPLGVPETTATGQQVTAADPALADQVLTNFAYGAEGEGSGDGSGSPPADPPPSDPPPSDPPPSDPPPSDPPPSDPPPNQAPTISPLLEVTPDRIIVSGHVSDDGTIAGLNVTLAGVCTGTVTTDDSGNFSIEMPLPDTQGDIAVSVMDANGTSSDVFYLTYQP